MQDFNPTIKAFYEKAYKGSVITNSGSYYYIDHDANAGRGLLFVAFKASILKQMNRDNKYDLSRFKDDELIYLFQGHRNEEEMLKIIKMKAFL